MIWKKYWPKFTVAFMVAIMAVMCIGSAVFADNGNMPQPYYYNPNDPGFKYLNPNAQQAAKVVGYGLQSLTPKYGTYIYRYAGEVTWYPNAMAYKAAAITPGQKNVKIGPWMWDVETALKNEPYTLPIGN